MNRLGNKDRARSVAAAGRRPRGARQRRLIGRRGRCVPGSPANRLSRPHQGGGRWRRPRHARRPRRGGLRSASPPPVRRPRPPSRTAAFTWRSTSTGPGTSRCSSSATARQYHPSFGRDARSSAGIRSWSRSRPRRTLPAAVRTGHVRGRRRAGQGGGLLQRRHLRVPGRPAEPVLLHRGQRSHSGRTPRHRARHRHRPGARADSHCRRRAAAASSRRTWSAAAPRSSAASTPRTRTPTSARRRASSRVGNRQAVPACASTRMWWPATACRPTTTRWWRNYLSTRTPDRRPSPACGGLGEFVVEGIHTTIPLHLKMFNHPAFEAGHVDTTFIERTWLQK